MASTMLFQCADCKVCFETTELVRMHECLAEKTQGENPVKVVLQDNEVELYQQTNDVSRKTMFQRESCKAWFCDLDVYKEHSCCISSEETISSPSASSDEGATWTRPPTLFLIEQYAMKKDLLDRGKMRKKEFWKFVAEELKKQDYNYSPEQVNGRWKTLTRNYKAVKDENKKSGSGRKDFEFMSEMDDIFFMDPAITPKATSTSTATASTSTDDDLHVSNSMEECKICMEAQSDCVIINCGHIFACYPCGKMLNNCAICRQKVKQCVKVYNPKLELTFE